MNILIYISIALLSAVLWFTLITAVVWAWEVLV
jgi:hypothetical protein